ncbi:putative LPS assembly protein LptD [Flectobacillus roseus]|uniref:LPS assembly protein LptD n=1 Tax=Flectobacillus roseus TaxID=502259 RepID=A0ABT6YEN6_9BACT|nr:putative LPS assembly protein LptD [Flectobacillus roseus]MDI9862056.1 putative LPS assembly protein LptD [Flectobacillus roseus]
MDNSYRTGKYNFLSLSKKVLLLIGTMFVLGFAYSANAQRLLKGKDNSKSTKTTATSTKVLPVDTLRKNNLDSLGKKGAKTVPDSLKKQDELETTVQYTAQDSTIMDTEKQIVYLYGDAKVTYGNISLQADFIKLNWAINQVDANGTMDSTTKKVKGKPVFKQGNDEYNADEIKYNFKSRKALIQGIVTQQGEGYVQGKKVKKDDEDNLYIRNAIYTTCNLAQPHFHINASKIKIVGKKEIVAGPFHLELNNIPLPIGLPFGFFPYRPPQESGTSGILMPTYGEEPSGRGFYLRDGGYYFALSPNIGVRATGEIYGNGSWGLGANSQYVKRYRYSGNFNVQYRKGISSDESTLDPTVRNDFSIQWSHSPQSRGNSSFSASVNVVSNSYNQYNSFVTSNYTSNATNSSVQYSKSFGQTIRTGASMNISQNTTTKEITSAINYNFGLNQIQPFKKKKAVTERFMDQFRFGLDFTGSTSITNKVALDNRSYLSLPYTVYRRVDPTDTDLNKPVPITNSTSTNLERDGVIGFNFDNLGTILSKGQTKMQYSIPISLPNIKLGRYINLTPGMSLSGNVYTRKYSYKFLNFNNFATSDSLRRLGAVKIDTTNGSFIDYQYAFTMSMNTRLYGTINFKNFGRLAGIRHVMTPSVSVSYTPDFTDTKYGFYQDVVLTNSSTGKKDTLRISAFNPTLTNVGSRSGGINFSLNNTIEAKVKAKSDTAAKEFEKITIIDNLSLSTNYNFFATKYKLAPVSFGATSRVKKFDINIGGTLDPYVYQVNSNYGSVGEQLDEYMFSRGKGLANLSAFNMSIGKSFKPGGNKPKTSTSGTEGQMKQINRNIDSYVDWSVPWEFQFSYQYNYAKRGLAPAVTVSAVTFSGSVKMTEKWDFKVQSGYDFINKGVSLTNISIHRDLHCWEMQFNWTPAASPLYGRASSYSFDLRVKSSLLQELKLSRRRSFYDSGGF